MKKFISMLLAVTMLISCLSLGVFAASESDEYAFGEYAITADKTEVAVGDTVTVTVSLKANAVFNVEGILTPSDNLEYASHEILAGNEFEMLALNLVNGKFAALGNFTGYTGDIDLLTITFTATEAGKAEVKLSNTIWTNEAGAAIDGNDATTLQPEEPEVLLGDVDGDGEIKGKDIVKMRDYLMERIELTDVEFKNADVTKDGEVTGKDIVRLRDYLMERISEF